METNKLETIPMTTEAVVADLAKQATEIQVMTINGTGNEQAVLAAIPKHLTLVDLTSQFDEDRGRPRRAKGTQSVHSLQSFIDLVTLRSTARRDEVILYLNSNNGADHYFAAVLNEHGNLPGFRDYKVVYVPKLSREWKIWLAGNDKVMTQADFAEFLEAQCLDIIDLESVGESTKSIVAELGVTVATPPGLKSLARDFSVKVKQEVREARALSSGETQIVFKTEHAGEDGKPLTVPGAFLVAIPIFENGPLYTLVARLRYRVTEGRVVWAYHLEQNRQSSKRLPFRNG